MYNVRCMMYNVYAVHTVQHLPLWSFTDINCAECTSTEQGPFEGIVLILITASPFDDNHDQRIHEPIHQPNNQSINQSINQSSFTIQHIHHIHQVHQVHHHHHHHHHHRLLHHNHHLYLNHFHPHPHHCRRHHHLVAIIIFISIIAHECYPYMCHKKYV